MPALVIRNKLRDPQHDPQHELRELRVVDRFEQILSAAQSPLDGGIFIEIALP
jgi:hypothetical protein